MPSFKTTLQCRGPVIDSRATTIYGFMGAFYPLAVAAFSLRVYTRLRFSSLGKDDVALLVGLILYTGLIIATVYTIKFGLGLHIWDVIPTDAVSMQKQIITPPLS
ncbi:hypothetical protein L207DRAFT_579877 [Hyaloscypha variabilis F]|uniref:Uncharacterized protein n=1 Tax=Hyaloscypha variabilis (strain UAMH 11265 / GT02V1 / F) TaxID=1149755 RepID=A0A2J6RWX2_HYAVF|nr:hypothetical protein L207DRAFT_579877 [Hyaloscypha variabilis F]